MKSKITALAFAYLGGFNLVAQTAEEKYSESIRIQEEIRDELRDQTNAIEDAAHDAWLEGLRKRNEASAAREETEREESWKMLRQHLRDRREVEREAESLRPQVAPLDVPQATEKALTKNPYDPDHFPSLPQYMEAHPDADPLTIAREYRDKLLVKLLKNGEYDEYVKEVDSVIFEEAVKRGWVDGTNRAKAAKQFFAHETNEEAYSAGLVHRYSIDTGEATIGAEALRYKVLLSESVRKSYPDQNDYMRKLQEASLRYKQFVTPEMILASRKAAVDRGDIPFLSIINENGNSSIYLGTEVKKCKGNDNDLAKLYEANPGLDRNLIGAVRKQLLSE